MSNYLEPKAVKTPKARITGDIRVVVDKGENSWSLCRLVWDGKESVGIRWNGSFNGSNTYGNPQSRGNATWFVLPDEVADVVLDAVKAGTIEK